jgi:hypothetical protein
VDSVSEKSINKLHLILEVFTDVHIPLWYTVFWVQLHIEMLKITYVSEDLIASFFRIEDNVGMKTVIVITTDLLDQVM